MQPFSYHRPNSQGTAIATLNANSQAFAIAGGTDILDLMKNGVKSPDHLIDINDLPLTKIEETSVGLCIGALSRLSDVARHPVVEKNFPAIAQALLVTASPQIRNMATIGGNLLQRSRCPYLRNASFACNRREPSSGCSAIVGVNRSHAILGASEHCICVHPSDLAVALVALDAKLRLAGQDGERSLALEDFYFLPGETPECENALQKGELIVGIDIPYSPWAANSHYLKVGDRAAFAFALVSVAASLQMENGIVRAARIVFGGVAAKPWRTRAAEAAIEGKFLETSTLRSAADAAVQGAKPRIGNAFKVEMMQRVLTRALVELGGAA